MAIEISVALCIVFIRNQQQKVVIPPYPSGENARQSVSQLRVQVTRGGTFRATAPKMALALKIFLAEHPYSRAKQRQRVQPRIHNKSRGRLAGNGKRRDWQAKTQAGLHQTGSIAP